MYARQAADSAPTLRLTGEVFRYTGPDTSRFRTLIGLHIKLEWDSANLDNLTEPGTIELLESHLDRYSSGLPSFSDSVHALTILAPCNHKFAFAYTPKVDEFLRASGIVKDPFKIRHTTIHRDDFCPVTSCKYSEIYVQTKSRVTSLINETTKEIISSATGHIELIG